MLMYKPCYTIYIQLDIYILLLTTTLLLDPSPNSPYMGLWRSLFALSFGIYLIAVCLCVCLSVCVQCENDSHTGWLPRPDVREKNLFEIRSDDEKERESGCTSSRLILFPFFTSLLYRVRMYYIWSFFHPSGSLPPNPFVRTILRVVLHHSPMQHRARSCLADRVNDAMCRPSSSHHFYDIYTTRTVHGGGDVRGLLSRPSSLLVTTMTTPVTLDWTNHNWTF